MTTQQRSKVGNIALACGVPLFIIGLITAILVDQLGIRYYLILPSVVLSFVSIPLLLLGIILRYDT